MLPLLRGPLPPPEEELPQQQEPDAAQRLARRFARVVTLHHRQRQLQQAPCSTKHRRHAPQTRNCAVARRRQLTRHEIESEPEPDDSNLDASIRSLQAHIATLERSVLLRDSATLLWRTNSSVVAMDLTREYFHQFARGYNSSDIERCAVTDEFMASVFREDILCRDFQGMQCFLDQWEKYTTFHQGLEFALRTVHPVDNQDTEDPRCAVTVYATGELSLTFTEDTLRFLYPSLFSEAGQSLQASEIVRALVGSRACLPMELVLNFDPQGRVFSFESRVNLVATLLDMLQSPSSAIHVHQSSIMTADGHWQTQQNAEEVAQRERLLPRQLL